MKEPAASDTRADWREWIARIALIFGAPAIAFALLEIALRLCGYGYPPGFLVRIPKQEVWTANQRFGWRFFPRAIARTPLPIRLPDPKSADTYRMFILGESAAMGVPEPAFSFGRILEAMLRDSYPGVKFEVVNAAMTAINSHAILPIASDCAARQPDLFVIYMGNNEVVGPYGPGTVFRLYGSSLPLIRAAISLQSMRVGELLGAAVRPRRELSGEWKGMAMFLGHEVAADDTRLQSVYRHFRTNLADTIHIARRARSGAIVCTVASNLKDSPPFASMHRRDFSTADKAAWDEAYQAGVALEKSGDFGNARVKYARAAALDDRFADLQFRLGRCFLALGQPDEARRHFVLARDFDGLRFRTDTQLNRIIRDVAANREAEQVDLVDAERIFDQAGIPGEELLYEHVHFNFEGNYLLAKTVFDKVVSRLPVWIVKRRADMAGPPSMERVMQLLPLTGWDRYRMAFDIFQQMQQPPFTGPLYLERRELLARRLAEMKERYDSPEALHEARESYAAAIQRAPEDLQLRQRFAELLQERGEYGAAAEQWRALLARVPDTLFWQTGLASALRDQGKLGEAVEQYRAALHIDPEAAAAHFSLATVFDKQRKPREAMAEYSEALRLRPDYAEALNNMGRDLAVSGRTQEAIAAYSKALEIKPEYAEAHNNLGILLAGLGRPQEAIRHYSEALSAQPRFAGAHYNLSAALVGAGRTQEAVDHLSEALRIDPRFAQAHFSMGAVLMSRGQTREAIIHFAEAARLKPDFAEAHNSLGTALARRGDIDQAIAHFSDALRLRPDFAQARRNLEIALADRRKSQATLHR